MTDFFLGVLMLYQGARAGAYLQTLRKCPVKMLKSSVILYSKLENILNRRRKIE
jgi:hypothetical protein